MKCAKKNLNRLLSLGCKSQIDVCNSLLEDERNGLGTCDLCMHISRDCLRSKKPRLRASLPAEKRMGSTRSTAPFTSVLKLMPLYSARDL